MQPRWPFLVFIGLLILAGISTAAFRHQSYGVPLLPGQQHTVWQVEARITYNARNGPAQVLLTLPPEQSGYRLIGERSASTGYGFVVSEPGTGQRLAHWSKRDARGEQLLYYELELMQDASRQVEQAAPGPVPLIEWEEPYRTAALDILSRVMPQSADEFTLAQQLVLEIGTVPRDQSLALLLSQYSLSNVFADLLSQANVPARRVQALLLEDGRRRQSLTNLVQVWTGDQWRLFHPTTGPIPASARYLLWQTDTPAVLEVVGGTGSSISFSVISHTRPSLELAQDRARQASTGLSLYSLPVEEQSLFKLVMLLPFGALVTVFMRVMIGVQTSGTFMPVLLALAFLQTELAPGLIILLFVVTLGLMIRSYLSSLNLLLVARIAILVLIVIGIMTVVSVLSYQLGLIRGLTITFFPMIIIAWTIERMSIVWEENGPWEVLIQGSGSLFVAISAYLVMDQAVTRHLAFNFPELHLIVLALILLLGRYTGYRLSELRRFASLSERH